MQTAQGHNEALCHNLESEEQARRGLVQELSSREDRLLAAKLKADAANTHIELLEKMLDDAAIEKTRAVQVPSNCPGPHSCVVLLAVLVATV